MTAVEPELKKISSNILIPIVALTFLRDRQTKFEISLPFIAIALLAQKEVQLFFNYRALSEAFNSKILVWRNLFDLQNGWTAEGEQAALNEVCMQIFHNPSNYLIQARETDIVRTLKLLNGALYPVTGENPESCFIEAPFEQNMESVYLALMPFEIRKAGFCGIGGQHKGGQHK